MILESRYKQNCQELVILLSLFGALYHSPILQGSPETHLITAIAELHDSGGHSHSAILSQLELAIAIYCSTAFFTHEINTKPVIPLITSITHDPADWRFFPDPRSSSFLYIPALFVLFLECTWPKNIEQTLTAY